MNLVEYFSSLRNGDYQNDNFNSFLKKVGFSFKVPSIHISGSNGKGTTANYIASAYRAIGKKVGLFTSPYLYEINEMTEINGERIPNEYYEKKIKEYEKYIKKFDISPFELQVFISLKYFEENKCDLCVIECGMGGEFDATNIFTPIMSVITSVSLEHTSYLGKTISEIALHKAGIIKERVPVVTGILNEDAVKVISDIANDSYCKLHMAVEPSGVIITDKGSSFDYLTYRGIQLKSLALYSVYDACIALEVIDALQDTFPITNEEIQKGFASVEMNCRMSIVNEDPYVIIDGAHNPEGIMKLKEALQKISFGKKIHVVFSCFTDKNLQGMLAILGEVVDEIILTTFDNPRARGLEDYFLFADDYRFEEDAIETVKNLIKENPEDMVVVTGSLAFAAYVKKYFDEGGIL